MKCRKPDSTRSHLHFIYCISSFKRRGVYKISKVLGAAFIGERRLLEGGVYIFVNVSLRIRKVLEK